MNILKSLTSPGNGNRTPWTFEQEMTLLVQKAQGVKREDLATVTGHSATSVTYKVNNLKSLAKSKGCSTEDELIAAVCEKHNQPVITREEAIEQFGNDSSEEAAV